MAAVKSDSTDIRIALARMEEKQDSQSALVAQLDGKIDTLLQSEIPSLRTEIGMLKIKSGVWGAIAGIIPAAIALIFMYLSQ